MLRDDQPSNVHAMLRPTPFGLYHAAGELPLPMAEDVRRVIRIHLGAPDYLKEKVRSVLDLADPGEKKAGLAEEDDAARPAGAAAGGGVDPDVA